MDFVIFVIYLMIQYFQDHRSQFLVFFKHDHFKSLVKSLSSRQPWRNSSRLISPSLLVSRRLKIYSTRAAASFCAENNCKMINVRCAKFSEYLVEPLHGDNCANHFQHLRGRDGAFNTRYRNVSYAINCITFMFYLTCPCHTP